MIGTLSAMNADATLHQQKSLHIHTDARLYRFRSYIPTPSSCQVEIIHKFHIRNVPRPVFLKTYTRSPAGDFTQAFLECQEKVLWKKDI